MYFFQNKFNFQMKRLREVGKHAKVIRPAFFTPSQQLQLNHL
jgi:hypothetical protein